MNTTTPPPPPGGTGEPGLSSHLLAFLASGLGYLRARVELAGIEGKEAASVYLKILLLLFAALVLGVFGYALLWIGLIALIAALFHIHLGWLVLLAAVLHFLAVAVAGWGMAVLWKKPVFTATMEEFRKDQEWLNRHT